MERSLAGCCLLSIAPLFTFIGSASAVEIPPMPKLKTFYAEVKLTRNGQPNGLIAVPSGGEYARLAQKVAEGIKKVSGADVPVKDATTLSAETLASSNMILLGYFANNPLVNRLYDLHYVPLDARNPEPGSYEVRTVHDPLGKGTGFVYLGGADVVSAGKAVDDFIAMLTESRKGFRSYSSGDIAVPHTVKVMLPNGGLPYKPDPKSVPGRIATAKGKNFRDLAGISTSAAASYYLTGNPDELEVFKQTVFFLRDVVRKMDKVGDARGALYLFNLWDVVEEAPLFSDQERADITQFLWEFANKFAYANVAEQDSPTPVGNDWDSRVAWDIARYFMKYYNVDVAGLWTWSHTRFRSKAKFWRSLEDCPGYGGMTIYDTFYYALTAPYDEFFTSGMARQACDYGIAVMNNLGGHAGFGDTSSMGATGYWANLFAAAAWKYKDGRYLYACNRTTGPERANFCYNTYLQNEVKPTLPQDLLGIRVVPLPDWVYEHRQKVLGTAPSQMNPVLDADPTPPREECFDKITFRTSFDPQDQYLILGGISHGYHAHPDGNSIIEFTANGRYGLFDSGYFVPDTIEHNTLVVYRDGLFEPIPRLTGLSALADFRDVGMTQTYLNGYNGVNWRRNIVWVKERYFLVIDEVEAVEPGGYGLNAVFRTLAEDKPKLASDRVSASHKGSQFSLVSASHTRFKVTGTTPPVADRHAVIEPKSAQMKPGDKQHFVNLLYFASDGAWPYEIVPAGGGTAMIKSPDGYAFAGTGKVEAAAQTRLRRAEPLPDTIFDAAVFYVAERGFAMAAGKTLKAKGQTWFSASEPVNVQLEIGETAKGTIEARKETRVTLGGNGQALTLPAGKHPVSFKPVADKLDIGGQVVYAKFQEQHRAALAALDKDDAGGKPMQAAWKVENARTEKRTVYLNAQGQEVKNLTKSGTAKCWTEAQRGARPRDAVDGKPETYCAVGSGASWSGDLPKDIGMEWKAAVEVGCFEVDYHDKSYAPASDGHQLQAWDGADWQPVQAEVAKDASGANWSYTFKPLKTTRIRVFITKFNPMRTAVREMRIFPEPASPEQRDVRIPLSTKALAACDLDGDKRAEVLVAAGNMVKCIKGDGTVVWQRELPKAALCVDACDLDGDGKGEVVVGGEDHKLYCFDHKGNERWSVLTPADPYVPEIEPATGPVRVLKCGDINGDHKGEIVFGSGNWFAYAYDHTGKKLWGALNWAHQPTSIAFVPLSGGKLGALIGTTYCDANLFGPDGNKLQNVSVGYHGAAMSVAAGEVDGRMKLIAGSRVGGLHCVELGSQKSWAKFMGAEVTQVAMSDLNGDGKKEIIAGSKNFHLLVTDADGNILWCRNVGEAIRDLAIATLNGNPAILVATEGGLVRVLDAQGTILSTFKAGGNVTKVLAADLNADGQPELVAASDDGFVYGNIR